MPSAVNAMLKLTITSRSLQDVFRCFWSENPECRQGRVIQRWKGWVLMVRTLEKYLDLCEIDDKRLENFYIKLPDECECKFSKNVPFNIDFPYTYKGTPSI